MVELVAAFLHIETVSVKRTGVKRVTCGECGRGYYYRRRVGCQATVVVPVLFANRSAALDRARQRVAREADARFEQFDEPVPCPRCDCVQESMLHELRMAHSGSSKAAVWVVGAYAVLAGVMLVCGLVDEFIFGRPVPRELWYVCVPAFWVGCIAFAFVLRWRQRVWARPADAPIFRPTLREGRRRVLPLDIAARGLQRDLDRLAGIEEQGDDSTEARRRDMTDTLAQIELELLSQSADETAAGSAKPWRSSDSG